MGSRRILLVGEDLIAGAFREYFRLCHGDDYEVESIEYCDDALTTLLHRPFDLVLLLNLRAPWRAWPSLGSPARHLGGESAILFLKQLRGLPNRVPVILVSGAPDAYLAEAVANGASAVIPKPIQFAEVQRVLDDFFRARDRIGDG